MSTLSPEDLEKVKQAAAFFYMRDTGVTIDGKKVETVGYIFWPCSRFCIGLNVEKHRHSSQSTHCNGILQQQPLAIGFIKASAPWSS